MKPLDVLKAWVLPGLSEKIVSDGLFKAWQRATKKSLRTLYIEATEKAVREFRDEDIKIRDLGNAIEEALDNIDIGIGKDTLGSLNSPEKVAQISAALSEQPLLIVWAQSHDVQMAEMKQILGRIPSIAHAIFINDVAKHQELVNKLLLQEFGENRELQNQALALLDRILVETKATIDAGAAEIKHHIDMQTRHLDEQFSRITQNPPRSIGKSPPSLAKPYGRDEDKLRLKRLIPSPVENHLIIVIHGPSGSGKSHFSAWCTEDIRALFPDPMLWVEAGPNPNLADILAGWGERLGLALISRSPDDVHDDVHDALLSSRSIIYIDDLWDYEHFKYLNVAGPHCLTLITTRRLTVAEEIAHPPHELFNLAGIPETDAFDWFSRLAPKTASTHPKLSKELLANLQHLPLGIKAAGSMLRREENRGRDTKRLLEELVHGSRQILKVEENSPLQSSTTGIVKSLQFLLRRSIDLLSEDDKKRFEALSVYGLGGTIGKDSLKAIWGQEKHVKTIDEMIDVGVLEPVGDRYKLHALYLLLAQDLADSDGTLVFHEKHANYYYNAIVAANELFKDGNQIEKGQAIAQLNLELNQINKTYFWASSKLNNNDYAQEWFATLLSEAGQILEFRQSPDDLIQWLRLAIRANELLRTKEGDKQLFSERQYTLLKRLGDALTRKGEFPKAIAVLRKACREAAQLGDAKLEVRTLVSISNSQTLARQPRAPLKTFDEVEQLLETIDDPSWVAIIRAVCIAIKATLLSETTSKFAEALELQQQALDFFSTIKNQGYAATTLGNMGGTLINLKRYDEAIQKIDQALEIYSVPEEAHWQDIARLKGDKGKAYLLKEEYDKARPLLEEAVQIANDIQVWHTLCLNRLHLGMLYTRINMFKEAIEQHKLGIKLAKRVRIPAWEADHLENLSYAYDAIDQADQAQLYQEQAKRLRPKTFESRGS